MEPSTKIVFFKSASEFRRWLDRNHGTVPELWLGFYKKDSGRAGITRPEAVDEALCFGWIDGIVKTIDAVSYMHRFTPRTARSVWSVINMRRVGELKESGRMHPSGQKAFEARDAKRIGIYSFENKAHELSAPLKAKFKANPTAWAFYHSQPPGYQNKASWWVVSAKKAETRLKRLEKLIADCANHKRLAHLISPSKK